MLAWQLRRTVQCSAQEIVLATTSNRADDPVVQLARQEGVSWFRGDEHDVLSRFVGAAQQARADVLVRLTADCPLIDPEVIDRVAGELIAHRAGCDYASNVLERTYPRGLDVEAFCCDTLLRMDRLATSQAAREHVTVFCRSERPDLFLLRSVKDTQNNADLRWTVDTEDDLKLIRTLFERLQPADGLLGYRPIISYVRRHPELIQLNAGSSTWDPIQQAA
jgi:spore coat polysaccharide biosynthesis protein SpsF